MKHSPLLLILCLFNAISILHSAENSTSIGLLIGTAEYHVYYSDNTSNELMLKMNFDSGISFDAGIVRVHETGKHALPDNPDYTYNITYENKYFAFRYTRFFKYIGYTAGLYYVSLGSDYWGVNGDHIFPVDIIGSLHIGFIGKVYCSFELMNSINFSTYMDDRIPSISINYCPDDVLDINAGYLFYEVGPSYFLKLQAHASVEMDSDLEHAYGFRLGIGYSY